MIRKLFTFGYSLIVALFACCAAALIAFAVMELWRGVHPASAIPFPRRFSAVLESIGLLTIAVAALALSQTILEEEVHREGQMNAPTRVRHFLSRFMLVIIVALGVESVVVVFQLAHDNPDRLPHAATIALAAAFLLAAWGVFVRLNKSVEELEPEAMERVKRADHQVEKQVENA